MRYVPYESEIKAFQKKHDLDHNNANVLLRGRYYHSVKIPTKNYSDFAQWVDEQSFTSPQYRYVNDGRHFFKDEGVATMVKLKFG